MSSIKQNSLIMTDFYTNGDNIFKKNLKEIEENLLKTDIMLIKKDENIFSTILNKTGDKLFIDNLIENKKFHDRSRNTKGFKKQATTTKSKSVIEEKKTVYFQNVNKTPSESKLRDKKSKKEINKIILKSEKDKKQKKEEDEKTNYNDKIVNIFTFSNNDSKTSCQSSSNEKLSINKSENKINYSWQDINSWLSPLQKKDINNNQKTFHLKKTYSWEIFGIETQTSNCTLSNIGTSYYTNNKHECTVKYSWEIIGKSTQVSINDYKNHFISNDDYWQGTILLPKKNYSSQKNINSKCQESSNKIRILYCERTQTSSDKETETEFTNCRIKYSWENLIQQYAKSSKLKKIDNCENFPTQIESLKSIYRKYSWENLINQHLNF
ncbi:uncharacterized protein LOC127278765 [Leptopilina boulardi]|uniref:uncharacterized protein LOC127278765 n=1 Tax=Leptopilina boulardi TaxID=63433 RepID=UPI0021F5EC4C|nr:uncharacterized protein LOC127278765 [Leptopilina boulardi]